jgi:hypothetical protein
MLLQLPFLQGILSHAAAISWVPNAAPARAIDAAISFEASAEAVGT